MRNNLSVLCIAVGLLCLATAPVAKAAAEPTEVLGVVLGKPMTLPECEKTPTGYKNFWLTRRCWTPFRDKKNMLFVWLTGDDKTAFTFISGGKIAVTIKDGQVAAIYIGTPGIDAQNAALEALERKFGKPTANEVKVLQNRMGTSFEVIDATWVRQDADIRFEGARGRIDEGGILAASKDWLRSLADQDKDKPQL